MEKSKNFELYVNQLPKNQEAKLLRRSRPSLGQGMTNDNMEVENKMKIKKRQMRGFGPYHKLIEIKV